MSNQRDPGERSETVSVGQVNQAEGRDESLAAQSIDLKNMAKGLSGQQQPIKLRNLNQNAERKNSMEGLTEEAKIRSYEEKIRKKGERQKLFEKLQT